MRFISVSGTESSVPLSIFWESTAIAVAPSALGDFVYSMDSHDWFLFLYGGTA